MSETLNLDGLLPEAEQGRKKKVKKVSLSRHVSDRKPIALNFSNANKPHATGLTYWQRYKLATPLFWCIFDGLAKQPNPENPSEMLSVVEVIDNVSPVDYAEKLMAELRNSK